MSTPRIPADLLDAMRTAVLIDLRALADDLQHAEPSQLAELIARINATHDVYAAISSDQETHDSDAVARAATITMRYLESELRDDSPGTLAHAERLVSTGRGLEALGAVAA